MKLKNVIKKIKQMPQNFMRTIRSSIRVLKLTTRPNKQEFSMVAKITGLLIVVIGFVGYVITSFKFLFG